MAWQQGCGGFSVSLPPRSTARYCRRRFRSQIHFAGPPICTAGPAVVNISVVSERPIESNPLYQDPFFRRFFDLPELPRSRRQMSAGSGVIVDAGKGYVLTNHHVVDRGDQIVVTLKDRRRFDAELVGSDAETDIALLKIDPRGLTDVTLGDSDRLKGGDFVVAVGNLFGLG